MCWLLWCAVPKNTVLPAVPRGFSVQANSDSKCVDRMAFDLYDISNGMCACGFFVGDVIENRHNELKKAEKRWRRKGFSAVKIARLLVDKQKALEYKSKRIYNRELIKVLENWLNRLSETTICYLIAYWQDKNKPQLSALTLQVSCVQALCEFSDNQWYQWCSSDSAK